MVNDRLNDLIEILNHNPNSFAQKIGVSSTVIYNIIKGRKNNPSFELLEKIGAAFPDVNMNWLILNKDAPLLQSDKAIGVPKDLSDIQYRMERLEKLAEVRDNYIFILQSKVDKLKEQIDPSKDTFSNHQVNP